MKMEKSFRAFLQLSGTAACRSGLR